MRVTDDCPVTKADGHDQLGAVDELFPGMAAELNDLVIGFEDAVGEPVLTHVLPDVLGQIELG